jgi:hypothetical protein
MIVGTLLYQSSEALLRNASREADAGRDDPMGVEQLPAGSFAGRSPHTTIPVKRVTKPAPIRGIEDFGSGDYVRAAT